MIGTQIQTAIYDALTASPAIASGRVYDRVPPEPTYPYLTIGDEQTLDDGNACDDGWELFTDVHLWSQAVGFPEVKGLIAEAASRLAGIADVPGLTLIASIVESTRVFRDPDGLTSHGVVSMRFVITPA